MPCMEPRQRQVKWPEGSHGPTQEPGFSEPLRREIWAGERKEIIHIHSSERRWMRLSRTTWRGLDNMVSTRGGNTSLFADSIKTSRPVDS